MKNENRNPNILEYAIVIVMVIISTIAMLFGKKINFHDDEDDQFPREND